MSPTIRTLVIPVSDLEAAKAVYTALLDAPHTDQAYYVGYDVDGFEVGLAPDDPAGGPATTRYRPRRPIGLPSVSASTQTRTSGATRRGALRSVAPAARRLARAASRSSTSA